MGYVRYSHARINARSPEALGMCDRCGFVYNHRELAWQFQWAGARLQNIRVLVCPTCMDVPQEQLRSIIIPADPVPIQNARQDPNMNMGQSSAAQVINNSSENVTPTPAYVAPGYQPYAPTTALSFSSATTANVTLSNNNQTALNTASTTSSQGAQVVT